MNKSSDKTALVTGGSRGIGRAVALALVRAGVRVAYCFLEDVQSAESLCEEIEHLTKERPYFRQADITVDADRRSLISEILDRTESLDILVNNAGTREDGLAIRMTEAWDRVLDLDLAAPFHLCQLVIPNMMKRSWGRIINLGSVASQVGLAGQANYTAAKAGLEGLTRALAREYGKKGITVNTVNPGFLETDLTGDVSEEFREDMLNRTALRRLPTADAIASVVAFLASEEAWAVTGQSINVDCGLVKL